MAFLEIIYCLLIQLWQVQLTDLYLQKLLYLLADYNRKKRHFYWKLMKKYFAAR